MKQTILIAAAAAISLTAGAKAKLTPENTDWYEVTTVNKPYVRWWQLGSAVDSVGLTYNLTEFAQKGLGGMEITPIYGVKGNEANDIEYLSPKWMDMYGFTVDESRRLGLQVDMNNGTGWPFGGPTVTTDDSARKLVVEKWSVAPGESISVAIVPSDAKQKPVATLQRVIAVSGNKRIDITDQVIADMMLNWTAPKKGNWTVYAIFSGRTFQKVKRAAPGGEGWVINHYDKGAVERYLQRFENAFAQSGKPYPESFFNDSFEVYGSNWDDNLLAEFYNDHGYQLELYIEEFASKPDAFDNAAQLDTRARVIRDYRATLARMLSENFTQTWLDWAHSHGVTIRNQSHGSPANIIDLYAMVDIPECESFGQSDFDIPGLNKFGPSRPSDADPAVLKFASSAAHVAGKPLTSAESLTWLTEHFCTSLANCKPELDQMFCSGVNHVYFHGAPYSPYQAAFPGYMFYASVNMSPTNSIWRDADGLFSYIARVQSFLTAGKPDNDFLLYFPIEDVWYRQNDNPYLMFEIHKMDARMPQVKKAVNDIIDAGYDCDYLSDNLLQTLEVTPDGKILAADGVTFEALILPSVEIISPESLQKILALANEGATVVIVGDAPSDAPGLANLKANRKAVKKLAAKIPSATKGYGNGRIIRAADMASGLAQTGVAPETMRTENGLTMIRRNNEVGGHNYFVALLENREIDLWVRLADDAEVVELFDPVTGQRGFAATKRADDGSLLVRLQLKPGQSMLIKTFPSSAQNIERSPRRVEVGDWRYVESVGEPILLDRGWTLSFLQSEPEISGVFEIDSVMPWTSLDVAEAQTNFGTARYSATFTLDEPEQADGWLLDLGDVRESAAVTINGKEVGKAWSVPFVLEVGEYLQPGENSIEIDVTNLQINRIIDFEKRGVEWRVFKDANVASVTNAKQFSFADWDIAPAGLMESPKLIPVSYSK